MAEWLKRPTHNWQIRRFNSYWMHPNRNVQKIYRNWLNGIFHNELIGIIYSYHNIGRVRTRILIDTETHREENGFMDGIKYAVVRGKSLRLLEKNQFNEIPKSRGCICAIGSFMDLLWKLWDIHLQKICTKKQIYLSTWCISFTNGEFRSNRIFDWLIRVLGILRMRIWFLLIPMRFLEKRSK